MEGSFAIQYSWYWSLNFELALPLNVSNFQIQYPDQFNTMIWGLNFEFWLRLLGFLTHSRSRQLVLSWFYCPLGVGVRKQIRCREGWVNTAKLVTKLSYLTLIAVRKWCKTANQWKPSIPSTSGAIWGPWNSMDLLMKCLEFLKS
jgi:hypothetical protein